MLRPWLLLLVLSVKWLVLGFGAAGREHGQQLVGFSRRYTLVEHGFCSSLCLRVQAATLQFGTDEANRQQHTAQHGIKETVST